MNTQPSMPRFTQGLTRPAWATPQMRQRGVLVGDGSPSMQGEKARHAEEGIRTLVGELSAPANKDAFEVGVVRFAADAKVVVPMTRAADAAVKVATLQLCEPRSFSLGALLSGRFLGGGTNITAGLEAAEQVLAGSATVAEGTREVAPLVLLFSDGCHNTGPGPTEVAERLKASGVTLVTIGYGADADRSLLCRLASTPQHFFFCARGSELRALFAAIAATLTASVPRGIDPRDALRGLNQ